MEFCFEFHALEPWLKRDIMYGAKRLDVLANYLNIEYHEYESDQSHAGRWDSLRK